MHATAARQGTCSTDLEARTRIGTRHTSGSLASSSS
jgi:hypothetical protein